MLRRLNSENKKHNSTLKEKEKRITQINKELCTTKAKFRKEEVAWKRDAERLQRRNDALKRALGVARQLNKNENVADLAIHVRGLISSLNDNQAAGEEFDMDQVEATASGLLANRNVNNVCQALIVDGLKCRLDLESRTLEIKTAVSFWFS